MPPAAPLPTIITSHLPEPGVIVAASFRDSSGDSVAILIERVESFCIREISTGRSRRSRRTDLSWSLFCSLISPNSLSLLPAVGTILAVLRCAANEFLQELISLVAKLAMDADLRRVVAANRCLLGHDEEVFERRPWIELALADVGEDGVDLSGVEFGERSSGIATRLPDRAVQGRPSIEARALRHFRSREDRCNRQPSRLFAPGDRSSVGMIASTHASSVAKTADDKIFGLATALAACMRAKAITPSGDNAGQQRGGPCAQRLERSTAADAAS